MFKLLERVKYEDVEINEIVSIQGCNWIVIKEGEYDFRVLADDLHDDFSHHDFSSRENTGYFVSKDELEQETFYDALSQNLVLIYKLPKEVQEMWKVEE